MIVNKKGTINIENFGLVITPELTLGDLLNNPNSKNFRLNRSNDDFVQYEIAKALIENLPFFVYLDFYKNKISQSICDILH